MTLIDPTIVHHFCTGIYAKQSFIPKGFSAVQHKHTYDHLSVLAQGKVIVTTDEDENVYTAPACILIKKDMHHAVEALEDCTWFCIHATDEDDAEKVDQVLIKKDEK
jgi:quercetin dioxygenase-like cupin family protein